MIPILSVNNLTKTYKDKTVVKNITFSLLPGQIFGFVGPNGAGKSTTIKMITGLTNITAGEVRICGYSLTRNPKSAIKQVGAVVETPQLYPYLTGYQNLKIMASFYDKNALSLIPNIVKRVGMENRINDKVSKYSLGMKQRLGIAQALLNNPKLLILDEPTNGLDPNGIVELRHLLKTLAEKNKMTIIISSHNLAELEQTCDVIGIINKGRLIEYKSMAEIEAMTSKQQKIQMFCNYPNFAAHCIQEKYKIRCEVLGTSIIVPIKEKHVATVISFLNFKKVKIFGFKKISKTLEELYFEILDKDRPSTSIV